MANKKKIKCPLTPGSGTGTFSDNLVGNQITDGSSNFTQTNFLWDSETPEKDDRSFITSDFSKAISLDDLDPEKIQEIKQKQNSTLLQFHKSKDDASAFSLYGSLTERLRVSVERIIKTFPAALVSSISVNTNILGVTATNITYNKAINRTTFRIPQVALKNDFDLEFSTKGNLLPTDADLSELRNFTKNTNKYVLEVSGNTYPIISYTPPSTTQDLIVSVQGQPFPVATGYSKTFLIRPSDQAVEEYFLQLSDLESALLNRESLPKYQASFKVPEESEEGTFFRYETIAWPLNDGYNLDIKSSAFENYLQTLTQIGQTIDEYKTNLITRFLITASLSEFDTEEQKIDKILKLYGHHFDDIKVFIDNIANMRTVTYDRIDNIPDLLLKNLCETLGLESVTTFTEDELNQLLYRRGDSDLVGEGIAKSVAEADVELYRRLLVNIGHLFKMKGTRKAIEFLMKFIGAPDSIVDFNEHVYTVASPLNMDALSPLIDDVVEGRYKLYNVSYVNGLYKVDPLDVVDLPEREDFPIDEDGYPTRPQVSGDFFFQKGAGWFERTTEHRGEEVLDFSRSVLTGQTKVIKTKLKEFTYGGRYLDRFRHFPVLDFGFDITKKVDNRKVSDNEDDLTLNVKNIDLTLSAAKGVEYDVWRQSNILKAGFGKMATTSGITFAEFADHVVKSALKNINKVKYLKKYTDLQGIYTAYRNHNGIKPFTYKKVEDYISRISPLWIRIVEQFIPATTIWFGGNKTSNSIFHRQKFRYKEPCKVQEFQFSLLPESFCDEAYNEVLLFVKDHPRGLTLYSNTTINPFLEVDGQTHLGSGYTFNMFTGYTKYDACGFMPDYGSAIPLGCNFAQYYVCNDTAFKDGWEAEVVELIEKINSEETYIPCGQSGYTEVVRTMNFTPVEWGASGDTITGSTICVTPGVNKKKFDYEVVSVGGTKYIKFKTYKYSYSDCVKDMDMGFEVRHEIKHHTCSLWAELTPSTESTDCTGPQDLLLKIHGGTPYERANDRYTIFVDCKPVSEFTGFVITPTANCDEYMLQGVDPSIPFELLIGDGANCQTRLKFLGVEQVCINPPTPTPTASVTPTVTPTVTPSVTPSVSIGASPTPTLTATVTPSITQSVTPSVTPTRTPTLTPSPTSAPQCDCKQYDVYNDMPIAQIFTYTDCDGAEQTVNLDAFGNTQVCSCNSLIGGAGIVVTYLGPCGPVSTTTHLVIEKDYIHDYVSVYVDGVEYVCDATTDYCVYENVLDTSTYYTISVSVRPANRPDAPIAVTDGTGSVVASCPACTNVSVNDVFPANSGINIYIGI